MSNLLVTPTILDQYEFAKNAPRSKDKETGRPWREIAFANLVAKIKRQKTKMPSWVWKGIRFENEVYKACKEAETVEDIDARDNSKEFKRICKACFGGKFQGVSKKTIDIDGQEVLFWGKKDVDLKDKIVDLKTCLAWKGEQKYLKGHQHKIYTWADGIVDFEYLVAEWLSPKSNVIRSINTVKYHVEDFQKLEEEIKESVRGFFVYLREHGLWNDYFYTFSKNG